MERLNKLLAHAGVGSRRYCDDLIFQGRVKINGTVVKEPGTKIDPSLQDVLVDGEPVHGGERLVYWLVNKPRGYLCTNHDPAGRPRAVDLIQHVDQRVYTVGRLDEDSEGLLLMTNDGDLAFKLTHPRFGIPKTYLVQVAGKPNKEDVEKLLEGVYISDGKVQAKRIRRIKSQGDSTWLEIVLCEGKNREIRRMLAALEHKVLRLKRLAIGPVRLDRLPKGKSRKLPPDEVTRLREAVERRMQAKAARRAGEAEPEEPEDDVSAYVDEEQEFEAHSGRVAPKVPLSRRPPQGEGRPMPVRAGRPVPVREGRPMPERDGRPMPQREGRPMPVRDNRDRREDDRRDDRRPPLGREGRPVPQRDGRPILGRDDRRPPVGREGRPVPSREGRPVIGRDRREEGDRRDDRRPVTPRGDGPRPVGSGGPRPVRPGGPRPVRPGGPRPVRPAGPRPARPGEESRGPRPRTLTPGKPPSRKRTGKPAFRQDRDRGQREE